MRRYNSITTYLFCLALVSIVSPQHSTAQVENPFKERLDATVEHLLDEYSIPGAAVALIENGRIVSLKGYGYSNIETGARVDDNTQFRTGSISKTFTAWAAMKLVEDGLLDLDAPVNDYLDRWELSDSKYDVSRVTMRRLLSHTAGTSVEYYDGYALGESVPDLPALLDGAGDRGYEKLELIRQPGIQWIYSDGGFALAELVIEEISGSTFRDYLASKIFTPLGFSGTDYTSNSNLATAYNAIQDVLPFESYASRAASGVYTTVSDLAEFVVMNLGQTGAELNRPIVLSEESILTMQTASSDTRGGYGLGFSTRLTPAGDAVVGHGASAEGWHANIAFMPARGKGIVILTNSSSGNSLTTRVRCDWYHDIIGAIPAGACKTDLASKIVKPLLESGVDSAIDLFRELISRVEDYNIDQWQLNGLGYDLIEAGRIEDAIEVFRVNVEFFTNESNPHDSLAEALLLSGDNDGARKHFQRALEIDPTNENARSMLERLGTD